MEFTDTNYHTGNRQATRIYTVQHRELYSIYYNNLEWKIIPNIYIYIWKTESLCYMPETNIVNQLIFLKSHFDIAPVSNKKLENIG